MADAYVVFAVTDSSLPASTAMTAFLVEAGSPGFSVAKLEHKMGMRGSPTGQLVFDEVFVADDRVVGTVGDGFKVAMRTLDRSRLGVAAQALGIAQGATDYRAAYARERSAFGKRINQLQAIQFKLADMETRTAAARELLYCAAAKVDAGEPDLGKYSAMAKVFCSDTAMEVTVQAIQVLGGYGYLSEYPVERMMRDAKLTQIYEGTNEIQRNAGAALRDHRPRHRWLWQRRQRVSGCEPHFASRLPAAPSWQSWTSFAGAPRGPGSAPSASRIIAVRRGLGLKLRCALCDPLLVADQAPRRRASRSGPPHLPGGLQLAQQREHPGSERKRRA